MFLLASGAAGLLRRCGTAPARALPRRLTSPRRTLLTRKGDPVRCASLDDAVAVVNHNDRVYVHGVAAVPTDMLQALSRRSDLRDVQLCHLHLEEKNPCDDPSLRSSFYTSHFFVGKRARSSVAQGTGHYIPVFLSEVPALMRRGILPIDVALLNVSPPDRHGYCSLGTEVAGAYPAAETAKIVVAQINPSMPRTFGTSQIHISAIDYVVEHDEPLPVVHAHVSSDVERRIGARIAELVPDGATLQMGIGAIPDAVLSGLHNHKDLGIHTEMFQEGLIDLANKGVVTNMQKTFEQGRFVTSFVMGTRRVYDFVHDNPTVLFFDSSVTNSPAVIGSNSKVVAINSAVEVDFTGQVCADSVGTRHVSGVGGQIDFERGAALSPGGIPIIALPSRNRAGEPRIVPVLRPGAGVITTRAHVHWVVTEWGAVNLFGKNMAQRAHAMIGLAHPDDRETLDKAAFERFKIKRRFEKFVAYPEMTSSEAAEITATG